MRLLFSFLVVFLPACATQKPAPVSKTCLLPEPIEIINVEEPREKERHEVFRFRNEPSFWKSSETNSLAQYRSRVEKKLGEEPAPRRLIELERQSFQKRQEDWSKSTAQNMDLALEGLGQIEESSCLQWRLTERQYSRFDPISRPTEFMAYILQRNDDVMIYFSGSDRPGARMRHKIADRVADDLKDGWKLVAHLHNHNFFFDREIGDRNYSTAENLDDVGGGVVPSLPDVHFTRGLMEDFGDFEVWVTNGFHTGIYSPADMQKLNQE